MTGRIAYALVGIALLLLASAIPQLGIQIACVSLGGICFLVAIVSMVRVRKAIPGEIADDDKQIVLFRSAAADHDTRSCPRCGETVGLGIGVCPRCRAPLN